MDRLKWLWFDIRRALLIKLAGDHAVVLNARVTGSVDNINPDWSVVHNSSFIAPLREDFVDSERHVDWRGKYANIMDRLFNPTINGYDGDHG